jgi:hypothetical protein
MCSTIAAIVELFPDPVTPVTRISPRSFSAIFAEHLREAELLEVRHLEGDHPEHDHERAALPEDVHPEAPEPRRPQEQS